MTKGGQARVEPHPPGEGTHGVALSRHERLEIEDTLPGIDLGDLGQHVALTARRQRELAERREEVVMTALGARPKVLH